MEKNFRDPSQVRQSVLRDPLQVAQESLHFSQILFFSKNPEGQESTH